MIGSFKLPISAGGIAEAEWTAPVDWIQLEEPANNEILLLTSDINESYGFYITCSGGTVIDWGDGTVDSWDDDAFASHVYVVGSGQVCSRGYTTFKVRITSQNINADITRFRLGRSLIVPFQNSTGLLWARFGTTKLTTLAYAFLGTNPFMSSRRLEKVSLPSTLTGCTSFGFAFDTCESLVSVDMPLYYSNSDISFYNTFRYCYSLVSLNYNTQTLNSTSFYQAHQNNYSLINVILPTNINNCTSFEYCFNGTTNLNDCVLPVINTNTNIRGMFYGSGVKTIEFNSSWEDKIINLSNFIVNNVRLNELKNFPSVLNAVTGGGSDMFTSPKMLYNINFPTLTNGQYTSLSHCFTQGYGLKKITNFPPLPNVTNISSIFQECYMLSSVDNLNQLGDTTTSMDLTNTYKECFSLENISCRNKITGRFVLSGTSTVKANLNSLLFTNPAAVSTWAGSSPQIDVAYCSLGTTALNSLFTSVIATSASFSGKTIRITGNPGADTCDTTIITNAGGNVNKTT